MMRKPAVDFVVIGVNTSKTINRCLGSILSQNYDKEKITIYYVDGGSVDDTLLLAKRHEDIKVVSLSPKYPTPGLQRNAGWRMGKSEYVMFMDSDTVLEKDFLVKALPNFTDEVGAVLGNLEELYPDRSKYNFTANLDWNGPVGEVEEFGGNVVIRRDVLKKAGGYDEVLVGGEDPELAQKVRKLGYKMIHLDIPMAKHDLAMFTISRFFKRAYRTGYGFMAVSHIHKGFWKRGVRRILIRGGGAILFLLLCVAGLVVGKWIPALILALCSAYLIFRPRIHFVSRFMEEKNIDRSAAKLYVFHSSICVIPEIFGAIRYYAGLIFSRPLRNKARNLWTG